VCKVPIFRNGQKLSQVVGVYMIEFFNILCLKKEVDNCNIVLATLCIFLCYI